MIESAIDPRDAILQAHSPMVMVPRFGVLPPMEKSGHRFLAAGDGIFVEVRRPWLHARARIAECEIAMPFGTAPEFIHYSFTPEEFKEIGDRFVREAREAMPNEHAAWAVWDESKCALEYRPLLAMHASPGGIKVHRPTLEAHQQLAIDLHSHGTLGAFFSGTDDEDDIGEVKYAIVAGTLDREVTFVTRLCLQGLFLEVK